MKVLWLCNVMIPEIARQLHLEASNKEGWISGLADVLLKNSHLNGIELAIAFPAPAALFPDGHSVVKRRIPVNKELLTCFGFHEDMTHPEKYDPELENSLGKIVKAFQPDIVHCFGTEYPHTLAMCRVFPDKSRILISLQGLCAVIAKAYRANLPEEVIQSATFRDKVRKDSIREQMEKFEKRGEMEMEAIGLAGNIAGRTNWDRFYSKKWNPQARYFHMDETLRPQFYDTIWEESKCVPHRIFLSQGDYPIKGLHYMIGALPAILRRYPDTTVYVAGNSIVKYATIRQKIRISGYGKYLIRLMRSLGVQDKIVFLGKLNADQMKAEYLKSNAFVCCSAMENSPNSLGEAMLLGMPCLTVDVGGIPSIFNGDSDGILVEGYRYPKCEFNNNSNFNKTNQEQMKNITNAIANGIVNLWANKDRTAEYCKNARNHAERNHKREKNQQKMTEIYTNILMGKE